VLDAVKPLLTKLGFHTRRGGIFTIELSEHVLGWLGLNRATKHRLAGEVEINPVVGVSHEQIERLVDELRGEKPEGYVPATISTPLGYLLPEGRYRAWIFTDDRAEAVAADMVATIAEYGLPFMRSFTDLDSLSRALEPRSKFAIEDNAQYRRPLAWLLAGDEKRAFAELEKALALLGERSDIAATDLRRFANAFANRLGGRTQS